MKHTRSALLISVGLLGLFPLAGCSKLKSALGKGDAGEASASTGLLGGKGPGPLAFLNGFEGEIDILAKGTPGGKHAAKPGAPESLNLVVLMKSGKIRADVPPGLGTESMGHLYGIFDSGEKKAYAVMDQKKQAIMIDLNKTGEHLQTASKGGGGAGGTAPTKPPPKITKTGKTDTVAGYTCELWDITDETGSKATMCIAEEGFSIFHIPLTGAPAEYAWMSELVDGKHIPLRVVSFDKAGVEEGRIEITKIDKKSEPTASFEVPAGYKIIPLEEMFKGAGAGGPPGGAHVPPHR